MAGFGALGLAAIAIGRSDRISRLAAIAFLLAAMGVGLAWVRAESVAAPVLIRPAIVTMTARVESVEPLPARGLVRVMLAPIAVLRDEQTQHPRSSYRPCAGIHWEADDRRRVQRSAFVTAWNPRHGRGGGAVAGDDGEGGREA